MIKEEDWPKIFKIRDSFIKEICKLDLYDYQKEISDKLLKAIILHQGGEFVTEQSRQSGKSSNITSSVIVFTLLFYYSICRQFGIYERDFLNIGIFAPQQQQSQTDFNYVKDFLDMCKNKGFDFVPTSYNGEEIILDSKQFPKRRVYCLTASPTSNTEGKTLDIIILEECLPYDSKILCEDGKQRKIGWIVKSGIIRYL